MKIVFSELCKAHELEEHEFVFVLSCYVIMYVNVQEGR